MSTSTLPARRTTAPQPCQTCRTGCDCDGAAGTPSCGHYACWGRATPEPAPRCPGVAYEEARTAVLLGGGEERHLMLRAARRRGSESHARVVAQLLTQAGLPVA